MRLVGVIVSIALSLAPPLAAQAMLEGRVREHTLDNGMKWLMLERHQSPTVSMYLRFKAGAVDEWTGVGGTAHLLEHMLFKGTHTLGTKDWAREKPLLEQIGTAGEALDRERLKRERADPKKVEALAKELKTLQEKHHELVLKDEIDEIYSKAGAVGFNAFTNKDHTTYVISLPANRLELWMRIEADRMTNPVLREYYSERDVVMEERRRSYDSRPGGTLYEQFVGAAFLAHPYNVPTIGWMSEIEFLSLENTEKFRRIFYAPNNTIAAVVGDIDPAQVIAMAQRYFGALPPQELPRPLSIVEPEQKGEKRVQVEFDASPQVLIGYHKPTCPSREDYVFDIVQGILSSGRTSRFYKNLVEGKQIAQAVSAGNGDPGARYANLFTVSGTPRHPHTVAELEAGIYAEIDKLAKEPVGAKELQKILNKTEGDLLRGMDSNEGLASQLSYFEALVGNWRYLAKYLEVIKTVRPEEIRANVAKYLVPKNRTVAELVRKPAPGGKDAEGKGEK
ncbi:MAG: insulinase family protein [Candidatus Wallbacteria bacterium]|nr:insulinase family protein [Candidatus Wallbacteria bacterium]